MHIHGPSHLHGAHALQPSHAARPSSVEAMPSGLSQTDQVDLSPEAQMALRLSEVGDVRADRVAEIRQAIIDGTYETEEKLSAAIDRLLDEIG